MQSSTPEVEAPVEDDELAPPAPAPLILLETTDDAGVCTADGWCD